MVGLDLEVSGKVFIVMVAEAVVCVKLPRAVMFVIKDVGEE